MANLLPPLPTGIAPGSYWWNDWYEKLRNIVNEIGTSVSWSIITGTPTTLAGYGITDAQVTSEKNNPNGYAGLNASSRITKGVDTTDDVIIDSTAKGLVLKSPNAHYWRASISNAGVVTWTDLGTTKP